MRGYGVRTGAGVALQRPDGGVPRSGEQGGGVGPVLGFVGELGVAQLVQRPALCPLYRVRQGAGGVFEAFGGAAVGQRRVCI